MEGALRGWTQMDPRAQTKVRDEVLKAAHAHGYAGTTVEEVRRNLGMN
jgi:hypothetical protein